MKNITDRLVNKRYNNAVNIAKSIKSELIDNKEVLICPTGKKYTPEHIKIDDNGIFIDKLLLSPTLEDVGLHMTTEEWFATTFEDYRILKTDSTDKGSILNGTVSFIGDTIKWQHHQLRRVVV